MDSSEGADDFSARSVPELIKHLWDLYLVMSLDPALEATAAHIRQAALTLEHTRRLAYEICQEGPPQTACKTKAVASEEHTEGEPTKWLQGAKTGSQLKH